MSRELRGQSVIARPLTVSDLQYYAVMFSPMVQMALHVFSVETELQYVHACFAAIKPTLFYGIFYSDLLVGAIQIRDYMSHASQLYGWLNEQYWGLGYYQEALQLVARYYFETTACSFLRAHVDVANKRGYYALKKCGFADFGWYDGPSGKQYVLILRNRWM